MNHYALNVTVLAPHAHFGEKVSAHIKASDVTEAGIRAEILITLMARKGIVVSKWWYLTEMELCRTYTVQELLTIQRDRFIKMNLQIDNALGIKNTIG